MAQRKRLTLSVVRTKPLGSGERITMRTDRVSRHIFAEPGKVYWALTTAEAVEAWLPPAGATGRIDAFAPRPDGAFVMTLIFETTNGTERKSSTNSDVAVGRFIALVPDQLVRQRFSFRSDNPAFAGEMDMTWDLASTPHGTEVSVTAENVPDGIKAEDHHAGMTSSLENLANYLEQDSQGAEVK